MEEINSIQLNYPDYKVDWKLVENSINRKTKMIIINTPQNPCGTIFSKEDMLAIRAYNKKHQYYCFE